MLWALCATCAPATASEPAHDERWDLFPSAALIGQAISDPVPITIQTFAEEQLAAVGRFNERLRAGGNTMRFPPSPVPPLLPKLAGRKVFQEYYVALDETGEVRGGYILKHQDFWLNGETVSLADFQLPISEGVVNRSYPHVAVQLLRHALKQRPLMFALGMGGYDEPVARLLEAAGWSMFSVPLLFRIVRPGAFLRNTASLRRRAAGRCLCNLLAMTGLGWLGVRAVQSVGRRPVPRNPAVIAEPVDDFSTWADDLWQQCRSQYAMTAVRDAETLRILYPKEDSRFIRLKIGEGSRPIGWAVLLNTPVCNHKHFGNMRLGSIVDCLAAPEDAAEVVGAARECLESRGAELIVSNQSHAAWRRGFQRAGFLDGPSNFLFASSPKLTELLRQSGTENEDLHFNRGDGDGPIHL
jgi:hypothetical protein